MIAPQTPFVPISLTDALAPSIFGSVASIEGATLRLRGFGRQLRVGDRVQVARAALPPLDAEVLGVDADGALAYAFGPTHGLSVGDRADVKKASAYVYPSEDFLGRVLNWRGETIDGCAPQRGLRPMRLNAEPTAAARRRPIGARVTTSLAALDTFLPLCRGQRIGVFAGSGVGKSSLLGDIAAGVAADVCVIALIGERGREVRAFVEAADAAGILSRAVIVASTSDEPALAKRECARLALAIAEYFRAENRHALLIFDSLTRFAEAHREVALARGEPPSLHAYPPSTVGAIAGLVERAGPGANGEGDVTAVFSVLVAGSDMDEPIADLVRGLLDGHIILDRAIAERGRFPAINVRRSVSRSLPGAASAAENALLIEARALIAAYENAELVVRAGLYTPGSDKATDRAVALWPLLDAFVARSGAKAPEAWFADLAAILRG